MTWILTVVIASILIVIGAGGFWYYHTLPISITINGTSYKMSYKTTYEDLHTQGYLTKANGDLLAVDGSVLETGGGASYRVYNKGEEVENHNTRIKTGAVITEARGLDTTEEYTVAQTTVPFTTVGINTTSFNFYNGSLHFYVNSGQDGLEETHTGVISGKTVAGDTLTAMIPQTFENVTVSPTNGQKVIALTFNDGPSTYTQQILDVLAKYSAKATFFEIGSSVEQYPEISKAVVAAGNQIASQSYSNASADYLNKLSDDAVRTQLSKAQQAIANATGITTTVIRPPGGNLSGNNIIAAGSLLTAAVGWDIDTDDWEKPGVNAIVSAATTGLKSGDIILLHDGGGDRTQTVTALDQICSTLVSEGYTFVTVDELMQIEKDQFAAKYATSS
jgi:peptidoglycan-N-acetylglucosamine deacetylase